MVVLKILQQYYSATNDWRVIDFMTRYFRYQSKTLPDKLAGESSDRPFTVAATNPQAVYWLYNLTGAGFLPNQDLRFIGRGTTIRGCSSNRTT